MISLADIVTEITDKQAWQILSNVFHNMPKYVFDDFVMSDSGFFQKELKRILKDDPGADEDDIAFEFEDWVDIKWKLKVLDVNPSDFTKKNVKTMIKRKFGDANPDNVPDDESRTDYQRDLAKKLKPGANEPVVVLSKGSELKLVEGWHRTMAILSLGNTGENDPTKWETVKLKAWVGTGSTVKNVW
jgi:hypothetical protein